MKFVSPMGGALIPQEYGWKEVFVCVFVRQTERETDILITQSKLIEKCDNNLILICADKNVITLLVISGRKKKKKTCVTALL